MSRAQTANKKTKGQSSNRNVVYWVGGGVIGLGLIVWLAFAIASEPVVTDDIGYGQVTVDGAILPQYDVAVADPTVGTAAPVVSGNDWDGNDYTIGADGRPKIIIFLAHWCSHCQAELPRVVDWLGSGGLPSGVDMYGITVLTTRQRPNWPPQDWLVQSGWEQPTIMDDQSSSAWLAYGGSGTPFYVVLDGDNNVLVRQSGEIGAQGLDALAGVAQNSISG